MHFDGACHRLDRDLRKALAMASRATLGVAVDQVEFAGGEANVRFRRYLEPVRLSGSEAIILRELVPQAHRKELEVATAVHGARDRDGPGWHAPPTRSCHQGLTITEIALCTGHSLEMVSRTIYELERRRMINFDLDDVCWKP
jgi:hypothetical protein